MAPFPVVPLHAASWPRIVVAVVGAHVEYTTHFGTIVVGKHDQRILSQSNYVKFIQQLANNVVPFEDDVAVRSTAVAR